MADERVASRGHNENIGNKFINDGSFMDLFKKKMEEQKAASSSIPDSCAGKNESAPSSKPDSRSETDTCGDVTGSQPSGKSSLTNFSSLVGKRRTRGGSKPLKTGIVKKSKSEEDRELDGLPAYLAEVHKYKSKMCTDEDKTRPLVK